MGLHFALLFVSIKPLDSYFAKGLKKSTKILLYAQMISSHLFNKIHSYIFKENIQALIKCKNVTGKTTEETASKNYNLANKLSGNVTY